MERLDKFLSDSGAGTRSQVKQLLKSGRVCVDGVPERSGSRKIEETTAVVSVDGEIMGGRQRCVVLMNKPAGFVTATEDAAERTVMELLPQTWRHLDLKPVGRLDKATEGLLLFTNDGDLLHRLISPRKGVEKLYYARHEGEATQEDVQAFASGLTLRDGTRCLEAELRPLGPGESQILLHEGKYHQVRRMMASRGMTVTYLERIREGSLTLDGLERGCCRMLRTEEVAALDAF